MTSRLITSWTDYTSALREVLPFLLHKLRIFDEDLAHLDLESADLSALIQRFLSKSRYASCEIVLRQPLFFRRENPRLMSLLSIYTDKFKVFECPPHLMPLCDNILVADDRYALVRVHKDHARSRVIVDDVEACAPYIQRFDGILAECKTSIHSTTLGL